MLGGGDLFYRWSEIADFQSIFARNASAVAPLAKSCHYALSNELHMNIVRCP